MPKRTLHQATVLKMACPCGKKKINFFDTKVRGLYLEIRCSGTRTFYLRYTDKVKRTRSIKISTNSDLTLKEVRQAAELLRSKIAKGVDPIAERQQQMVVIITFAQLVDEYYVPYIRTYKKSWINDVSNLKRHILPVIGHLALDQIKPFHIQEVVNRRRAQGGAAGSVNLSLILLKYIFGLALSRWEVPGLAANPALKIRPLPNDNCKERYLSAEEILSMSHAVNDSHCLMLKYIFPMLLLTGARKREVLDAKWCDIDMNDRVWLITKTKSGKPRRAFLCEQLMVLLDGLRRTSFSGIYVFANPSTGMPYQNIFTAWNNARKKAGLEGVRLHDLRHSFASILINDGRTLYEVQRLLGHATSDMTQRYAHLTVDTLREAADSASQYVHLAVPESL